MTQTREQIIKDWNSISAKIERLKKAIQERDQLDDGFIDSRLFLRADETLTAEITLGRQTGYGPEVSMPCTMCIGSDRYAMEVLSVSQSGHRVGVSFAGGTPE